MTHILICGEPETGVSALCDQLVDPADPASPCSSPQTGGIDRNALHWRALMGSTDTQIAAISDIQAIAQCAHMHDDMALAIVVMTPHNGLTHDLRKLCVILQQIGLTQALLVVSVVVPTSLSEAQFAELALDFEAFATALGLRCIGALPVSSHNDGNDLRRAQTPSWYAGLPLTDQIIRALNAANARTDDTARKPARLAISHCKPHNLADGRPGTLVKGGAISGAFQAGNPVIVLPSADRGTIRQVSTEALGDLRVLVEGDLRAQPGEILAAGDARPELADQIAAHIVWLDAHPLLPGRPFEAAIGDQRVTATVSRLKHKINPDNLEQVAVHTLSAGDVGFCNFSFDRAVVFDAFATNPALGRITVHDMDSGALLGFGQIEFALRRATNIHWQALAVDRAARADLKGQQPCCLWFTGLSGSGKSTVASLLEKRLHALGRHTYTLDGDNVRHGLNRDLGFTDADRVENIRRVSETAKLFVESGLIVMVSFISPFRAERQMARTLFDSDEFLEIFVDTPLEICEERDPKGLYKKARSGELKNFTGIDSVYESPDAPEIHLDAAHDDPEALIEQIMATLEDRGMI